MGCEKCRLKKYCGCYSLQTGAFSIAIYCIIFAGLDLLFEALDFGLSERDDEEYIIVSYISMAMHCIMIILSVILLVAALKRMIRLVWPWLVFAPIYLAWRILDLVIRIYVATTISKKKTAAREYVRIIFDIFFVIYFSYGIIVVWSYLKELRSEKKENADENRAKKEQKKREKEEKKRAKEQKEREKEAKKREMEAGKKEKEERRGTATSRGGRSFDGSRRGSVTERKRPSITSKGRDSSTARGASSLSQGKPQSSVADGRTSRRSLR